MRVGWWFIFLIAQGIATISEHLVREKCWKIVVNVSGGRCRMVKQREMMR